MPSLKLESFSGIVPRTGPTLLQDNQAQIAKNLKLQSGEIRPWRAKDLVHTTTVAGVKSIYKFQGPANRNPIWLEWAADVNVVAGPVADTGDYRLYYTSDSFSPKKTNWALASGNDAGTAPYPNGYYELGTPAPISAPIVSAAGAVVHPSVTITAFQIATLNVGDILNVTVDENAAVNITLTAGTGGEVTAQSLSTQLDAITGLTTSIDSADVVVTTESATTASQIIIKKQTGTTDNYDSGVVTYTTFVSTVYGTSLAGATTTLSNAQITGIAPNSRLAVTINGGATISITVVAGAGTFPPAVTATSLKAALTAVAGINVTVDAVIPETLTITTVLTGTTASIKIDKINPRVDPVYTTVAQTSTTQPVVETRSYVYTIVTEFGTVAEESAPSPAALVTCNTAGDTVTITGFATPPTGNYNFKYRRIYRTVSGSASTTYQLVAEIPVSQASYADTKSVTELGQIISSLYYTPPPSDLQGIVAMPNGMLAGFRGSEIWFCEPYLPHAWPDVYVLTTEFPIVGLGVFGNSLVVGTTKQPYLITGSSPTSLSQDKLPMIQPCVSKRSIASDQYGVIYASPNGLISIGPGTQDVISTALYTRDEWQAINPTSMIGALYNNMYFGFYKVGSTYGSIVIQRGDIPPLVNFDADADAVFVEPTTGYLHILSHADNNVYTLDTSTSANSVFQWRSKKFLQIKPLNYAALQVHADYAYMSAHAGSYINIKIYLDGTQVFTGNITSDYPVRLPAVSRGYNVEIEVNGNVPVRRVSVATSMAELTGI